MAKTKAELESDARRYRKALDQMRKAHRDGEVLKAIRFAVDACDYIDGMMQFEKRFEKRAERESVETIAYIFKYAPLVFDHKSLDAIAALLKSQKRIDKIATDDLAAELASALELMWDAHRLWKLIKAVPGVPQDQLRARLGGSQDQWRGIAESWDDLNIIQRTPLRGSYSLSMSTSLMNDIRGKCSSCGATGKASIGTFLDALLCPKCEVATTFVMLPVWETGERV